MMFVWVLILAVLAVFLVRATGQGAGTRPRGPAAESPLDILRDRYARGEITREEYEEMRRDLER